MSIWVRRRLWFLHVYVVRCQYCREVFAGIRLTYNAAQQKAIKVEVAHYKLCRQSHPIERLHENKYPAADTE